MYNFYKVKSKRNQQEFRHPFFRKDQAADLKYIKRKNVNKNFKERSECTQKEDQSTMSNATIKEQIDKLQGVLDFISEQNKTLVNTNKDIVTQLYNSKTSCEAQVKEFIAMLFVTISVSNTKLTGALKDYLASLKINQSMIPNSVFLERNLTNIDAIIQNNTEKDFNIPKAMDQLLCIYKSYLPSHSEHTAQFLNLKKDYLNDKRQALAVIENLMEKPLKPQSNEDCNRIIEPSEKTLEPENINPTTIKTSVTENKNSSLASIRNEIIVEDLNKADYLFRNFYDGRDNDLISLSEFVYTPVTPLFQEEI